MGVWEIVGYCITAVLLILNIIQFILNKFGKTKAAGYVDKASDLIADIQAAMIKAKESGMPGGYKKQFVKSTIMLLCNEIGVKYDDAQIDAIIESFVNLSKTINAREQDKNVDISEKIAKTA